MLADEEPDKPAKQEKPLPKPTEVLEQIRSETLPALPERVEMKYRARFTREAAQAEESWAHLQGIRDHYKHKGRWSNFLIAVMAFMVGFQSWLLYNVGVGKWDYSDYDWLLPALLVQNLAQVIGLAVFVVKALFKDMDRKD